MKPQLYRITAYSEGGIVHCLCVSLLQLGERCNERLWHIFSAKATKATGRVRSFQCRFRFSGHLPERRRSFWQSSCRENWHSFETRCEAPYWLLSLNAPCDASHSSHFKLYLYIIRVFYCFGSSFHHRQTVVLGRPCFPLAGHEITPGYISRHLI